MYKKPLSFTLKSVHVMVFELYTRLKTNYKAIIAMITLPLGHH